jgi:hypothetical protein
MHLKKDMNSSKKILKSLQIYIQFRIVHLWFKTKRNIDLKKMIKSIFYLELCLHLLCN